MTAIQLTYEGSHVRFAKQYRNLEKAPQEDIRIILKELAFISKEVAKFWDGAEE